jgi:hypothetical protein
LQESKATQQQK